MEIAQQKPEAAMMRAGQLVDRILEVTSISSTREAFGFLAPVLPEFSPDGGGDKLAQALKQAVVQSIKLGTSSTATSEEQQAAERTIVRLEEYLYGVRAGAILTSPLSIAEARELLGGNFIGPEHYERHLGVKVAAPPPLPAGMTRRMLGRRCDFAPGQRLSIADTHLLAYFPPEISGHALTINNLGKLVAHNTKESGTPAVAHWSSWYAYEPFADAKRSEGRWALLPKVILPGSTGLSLSNQEKLLRRYPGYECADAREIVISHTLNFLSENERLFPQFGRCRNQTFDQQNVNVGFSSTWGFVIDRSLPSEARPHIGLAVSRRLYLSK